MAADYYFDQLRLIYIIADQSPIRLCYALPFLIPFTIRYDIEGGGYQETRHRISQVWIELAYDELTRQPYGVIIPCDKFGCSHEVAQIRFEGACSVIAVLSRMGYMPFLFSN